MPHLSTAKRGYATQSCLIEVVNAILYKLKTGCQWAFLQVKALFSGKVLTYGAVFHHYNKWSKTGEWKTLRIELLDRRRTELGMSSVDLDGSHTTALHGGELVGYQGCKKRKTSNAIYLTDRQGLPLTMSSQKLGEHHDVHDTGKVIGDMFNDLEKSNIRIGGLFLNADAGFDCDVLRNFLQKKKLSQTYA